MSEQQAENKTHENWEPFLKDVFEVAAKYKLVALAVAGVFGTDEGEGKTRLNLHSRVVMPDGIPATDAQNLAVELARALNGASAGEAARIAGLGVVRALIPESEKPVADA